MLRRHAAQILLSQNRKPDMSRNFGVRQSARDYWNEPGEPESHWPTVLLVVGVIVALAIAIFVV